MTVDLPDNLVLRLSPLRSQLPQILEMGLREWNSDVTSEFSGLAEILECLAGLPTPEEILALRPSEKLTEQISALLEKNRTIGLNDSEERLWQHYEYVEYLVQMAKAKALLKLKVSRVRATFLLRCDDKFTIAPPHQIESDSLDRFNLR